MKVRLVTAATIAGALALSMSGAQAAPKVLDGKTLKVLEFTGNGGAQDNDKDYAQAATGSVDRSNCQAPRCGKLTFVYKPAKGVKGDLMFTLTWANPASDIDLYVAEIGKTGDATTIAQCGGTGTASEKVFLDSSTLKAGKTYALVADYYRSLNETVKGKVEIGVPSTVKATVPAAVDKAFLPVNCTL